MSLNGGHFRTVVYNAASSGNLHRVKVFADCHRDNKQWIDECFNSNCTDRYPLVIAARNGHTDLVEYMLEIGADPTVRGCVEFDNDNIQGTPPLWAASAAGHIEIVKLLVEGACADVNQATNTQSTPLRGACYDGHLHIVQYLLRKGADPHIPNRHGHTCLMIAAYRNKLPIVNELIANGMDVNIQTERGNSALHDAAESGNVDVVKALISAGAKMAKDITGVDPLICAAQAGSLDVVNFLSEHQPSGIRKRDAMKLLGSTMMDKKMDAMTAMVCWRKAMDVPLSLTENNTVREMETYFETQSVYDHRAECQYKQDIEDLEGNIEAQRMQALIIRERILGGAHSDVHYYLRFRGAVYCDMGLMNKCYDLWKHAFELQQKHFDPMYSAAITTLVSFQETFAMTLNDFVIVEQNHNRNLQNQNQNQQQRQNNNNQNNGDNQNDNEEHDHTDLRVRSIWVQYVFGKVCEELERVHAWDKPLLEDTECCGKEKCQHASEEDELKRLVLVAVQLINIRDRLSLPSANTPAISDVKNFDLDLARFVNICEKLRIPLLHYALEEKHTDGSEMFALPKAAVLEELLNMGLDVNAVNKHGDTPMHIVLRAVEFRKSLVRALLAKGADILMRNAKGEILLEMMRKMQLNENEFTNFDNIRLGRYITLSSIAAHAMRVKHKGEFDGVEEFMPPELRRFYLSH